MERYPGRPRPEVFYSSPKNTLYVGRAAYQQPSAYSHPYRQHEGMETGGAFEALIDLGRAFSVETQLRAFIRSTYHTRRRQIAQRGTLPISTSCSVVCHSFAQSITDPHVLPIAILLNQGFTPRADNRLFP